MLNNSWQYLLHSVGTEWTLHLCSQSRNNFIIRILRGCFDNPQLSQTKKKRPPPPPPTHTHKMKILFAFFNNSSRLTLIPELIHTRMYTHTTPKTRKEKGKNKHFFGKFQPTLLNGQAPLSLLHIWRQKHTHTQKQQKTPTFAKRKRVGKRKDMYFLRSFHQLVEWRTWRTNILLRCHYYNKHPAPLSLLQQTSCSVVTTTTNILLRCHYYNKHPAPLSLLQQTSCSVVTTTTNILLRCHYYNKHPAPLSLLQQTSCSVVTTTTNILLRCHYYNKHPAPLSLLQQTSLRCHYYNKHPALSLLQIRLILVGPHVSNLGDPGVVQLVLLGRVAHGRHGFGHAAVAIKVRLGRDVLVEEADDDSSDDSGDGRDDGEVESPGEGVEDRPLHFLSELSHDHHAL